MKKIYLVMAFTLGLSVPVLAQEAQQTQPKEVVFQTQSEKEGKIKRLEEAITKRKAAGFSEADLKKYYAQLEVYKKAKVLKTKENEK